MKEHLTRFPRSAIVVIAAVGVLYCVGLACIYATEVTSLATPVYTIKQLVTLAAAFVVAWAIHRVGYAWFAEYAYAIVALAILALIPLVLARLVSFGELIPNRRGSYRWIQLPFFQLQPSEFMKVAYIIGLAEYLRYRKNHRTFRGLLVPVLASMIPMMLILLEPDLGTVILMMPVLFVMLYAAGARFKHLALLVLIVLGAVPVFWTVMEPYQKARVLGVLLQSDELRAAIEEHPEDYAFLATKRQAREWRAGSGMQLIRSKAALGSGGAGGHGWAEGTFVEYDFLPDRHNDFIFAMIGHQWGIVGCVIVLGCYVVIVFVGLEIAAANSDPFARLLSVGVVSLIAAQVSINVGMTVGLMPVTGMTLPFVSYGGSSLLSNAIGIALLVGVSRHRPFVLAKPAFEFPPEDEVDSIIRPVPHYPAEPLGEWVR